MKEENEKLEANVDRLKGYCGEPIRIMEVCGTHTMSVFRYGIREILPAAITLVSGPGCPVCVTPGAVMDAAAR
ncbi:MAG: hydrogenase formation protein HypD, partial [Clostridiales bacterium]|nr:hydrogenase formation protein HypD [Clostridiales bacterium]